MNGRIGAGRAIASGIVKIEDRYIGLVHSR